MFVFAVRATRTGEQISKPPELLDFKQRLLSADSRSSNPEGEWPILVARPFPEAESAPEY